MAPRARPWVLCALLASACVTVTIANASNHSAASVCGSVDNKEAIKGAQALLNKFYVRTPPPTEINSHHAVLLVPNSPLTAGGGFATEAFASLPRVLDGRTFTSAFSKFVVVGHAAGQGMHKGIEFGDDVCGAAGYTDELAARFFGTEVQSQLSHFAPDLINCGSKPEACQGQVAGMDEQLAFLGALLGPFRSVKGSLLPVMLHGQGIRLGSRLGDALTLLVAPGGIWEAERVLFIISGDLSKGLPAAVAKHCDQRTTEMIVEGGVPRMAEYIEALLGDRMAEGCPGKAAVPEGYAPMLTAARVAGKLKLFKRQAVVAHYGLDKETEWKSFDGVIRGYASVLFWQDSRSVWERLGAKGSLLASGAHRDRNASVAAAATPMRLQLPRARPSLRMAQASGHRQHGRDHA